MWPASAKMFVPLFVLITNLPFHWAGGQIVVVGREETCSPSVQNPQMVLWNKGRFIENVGVESR